MPELFPTITQYASPNLIQAIAYCGHDPGDDPRWPETGAPDRTTYARWCRHICGIACLRMTILARTGQAPTLFELLEGAAKYGAYEQDEGTGRIRGLIYAPFADYVRDTHGIPTTVHRTLTIPQLVALVDAGNLVMTSVSKMIRHPDRPSPGKGGHLVLVTHLTGNTIHFRNPSGHTPQARRARIPLSVFNDFYGQRAVSFAP